MTASRRPAEDIETALAWTMAVPARVRAHLAAREIDGDDREPAALTRRVHARR